MSTKNLRELVEISEEAWPGRPINAVARKELEAIERAAKLIVSGGGVDLLRADTYETSANLLESIAEDAP